MRLSWTSVVVVIACLQTVEVRAGVIESFASVSGPGLSASSTSDSDIHSFAEGNDDLELNGGSSNFLSYSITFGQFGHIDIVFQVASTSGDSSVTEYDVLASHTDGFSTSWTQLKLELGFLNAGSFVSAAGSELDFDAPDAGTYLQSTGFVTPTRTSNQLTFTDGQTNMGTSEWTAYTIDVPGRDAVPNYAHTPGGYQFVVRITPASASTVPEPALGALLPLALPMWRSRN